MIRSFTTSLSTLQTHPDVPLLLAWPGGFDCQEQLIASGLAEVAATEPALLLEQVGRTFPRRVASPSASEHSLTVGPATTSQTAP